MGANKPQGIGAATALAFAREGAKVVLVYRRVLRKFDADKTFANGPDRSRNSIPCSVTPGNATGAKTSPFFRGG